MRIICTLLLMLTGFNLTAQMYNNEWINTNQTYFKFKVGKTGLYRIPQSTLVAAGLTNVPVEQLELYRNGVQVPFYPSVPSGILPANGYIEIWGEINDGKTDRVLYRQQRFQHTTKVSLFTDSAAYFLTTGSGANPLTIQDATNDVAGNTLQPEPYFMYTYGRYFKENINKGYAAVLPEYVYLSSFDQGEFYSTNEIKGGRTYTASVGNLYVAPGVPDATTMSFGGAGAALNTRNIQVRVNNATVKDTVMDYFNDVNTTFPIANSSISQASFQVQFVNPSPVTTDRMVVSYFEFNYPRQFNFDNQANFEFSLPPKLDGYFLQITNFNGGTAPVLYDLTNRKRYAANVSGITYRFALPPSSSSRRLIMVNEDAGNVTNISQMTQRNFVNYSNIANSADSFYLIITSPIFFTGTSGNNPIDDYKVYRESLAGGGHKVLVADINDLTDQFSFGIEHHPLSIKNFLRFGRTYFGKPPSYAFLIGRGMTYWDYFDGASNPQRDRLNLIPTFGFPGSDNLLSAAADNSSPVVLTPIGRLSVVYSKEIEDYLDKVKDYENVQQTAPATLAGREWMKNVVHVTGSSDPTLGAVLCNYMGIYRQIIEDTLFGGKTTTFCKVSTNSVEQITSSRLTELFAEGISLLTYFGHSSNSTLEFNIDDPYSYSNQGKYPVFCVNGCNAGNFFTNNEQRLQVNETLSEKFVLAKKRGVIAFIASTHFGMVSYLNFFINNLYAELCKKDFGKSLGQINKDALADLFNATGGGDYYARMHAEQITLHGDPALKLNGEPKPDYVMEESLIRIEPAFLSVAESNFQVKIRMVNIGRAVSDSIMVDVKQQYPNGTTATIYHGKTKGIRYADSLTLTVPVNAARDKGLNKITVMLDADFKVDEMSEDNNTATKEFFIYDEEARPVYPYNFGIVNDAATKFYASTANPFNAVRSYTMEIDTTETFNSALKVSRTISSPGGLLEFTPGLAFQDSTVYYWRVATVPPSGGQYQWNEASFTYMAGPNTGFGQDHYFQHLKSETERVFLQADRKWRYGFRNNQVYVRQGVYPDNGSTDHDYAVNLNDGTSSAVAMESACVGNSLVFNIVDPVTFKPWRNTDANNNNLFLYGSGVANCGGVLQSRRYNFEYSYMTPASRKLMMDFMDIIPNGYYVVVRSFDAANPQSFSETWRGDTTIYGSNNSLYHKLLAAGFTNIDAINRQGSWAMVYKKNDPSFTAKTIVSVGVKDRITMTVDCPSNDTLGFITSPKFGPAKAWHQIAWRGTSVENPSHDKVSIDVFGVNNNNISTYLFTLGDNDQNYDISSVDPVLFPYLQMKMRNADSVSLSPFQLRYWNIYYTPVPEGALAPNLTFTTKDTTEIGEIINFSVPFKNISKPSFDSVALKLEIIDRNNVPRKITLPKLKPIVSGDTALIRIPIDTKDFPENNTIHLDVNPDFAQPEQYHFNNFLFRNFYVKPDKINPLLDVTFDGVHIINRDIVSSKPHIQIRLKDESKYMLLNDTSISTVEVKFPDNSVRQYHFDNDTLRFTPATSGVDNSAMINFTPTFTKTYNAEGDDYELSIKAKDRSGNSAGTMAYRVAFRVINKPMISNLLNYPNPFSTSTAFVFTLTGSEVPQNIKIQILTVTGKIVREITKDELGPIHIGRNITEFKWNGNDQYGQKLANGVYLYRVVTMLNGKRMDKYKAEGDDTDKYFNNGYGKMYLMR